MPTRRSCDQARDALAELLGHEAPRPGQVEAIASVLDGNDTIALLPTGAGKSSIYQVAAALIPGPTVVVSPLIALQHDQRRALDEADVGDVAVANATVSEGRRQELFEAVAEGEVEFLLLAPEQLRRPDTIEGLVAAAPSLFVVDEAHCVSTWGHDFRPDYLRLAPVIEALDHPPVLALTATAAPPVRDEIARALGLRDHVTVATGFDRPEILLAVEAVGDEAEKRAALLDRALTTEGPGIVYAATRRETEEVAQALAERGATAAAYHAGLPAAERRRVLEGFLDGAIRVVAATTAFGLGIDKPDVRFVLHLDPAESLDAHYQEVGRAGRDGEPAQAVLFWRPEDLAKRGSLAGVAEVDPDEVVAALAAVGDGASSTEMLAAALDAKPGHVDHLVNLLAAADGVTLDVGGGLARTDRHADEVVAAVEASVASRRALVRSRQQMVRAYAEARSCRRALLLAYFGEHLEPPCGACDRCLAGAGVPPEPIDPATAERFPIGASVAHAEWGPGLVVHHEGGDRFTALFDDAGYRSLVGSIVVEHGLLEPVEG